jgi:hypothetical protein
MTVDLLPMSPIHTVCTRGHKRPCPPYGPITLAPMRAAPSMVMTVRLIFEYSTIVAVRVTKFLYQCTCRNTLLILQPLR